MEKITTKSLEETQAFAEQLSHEMRGGEVLLLSGDLGAGKTSFTQGFAKGLGITQRIISPTFIIMRSYDISDNKKEIKKFFHVDLYRTQSEHDIEGLGLLELMNDKENIVVIEWPDRLGKLKPQNRWELSFTSLSENSREITIEKYE